MYLTRRVCVTIMHCRKKHDDYKNGGGIHGLVSYRGGSGGAGGGLSDERGKGNDALKR